MRTISAILDQPEPGSRLRFKSTVVPLVRKDGELLIFTGSRHFRVRHNPVLLSLVTKLGEGHESSRLLSAIASEGHDASQIRDALEQLSGRGLLFEERSPVSVHPSERFARQLDLFAETETDTTSRYAIQDRLAASHVAQIGVGGLGTWIALALAPTGVGRLTLIDGDTVALSNLNRQILYREDDLGRSKVEAAARQLLRVNPELTVDSRSGYVDSADRANDLIPDCDLLVVAADEPYLRIRDWITEVCQARHIPHLFVAAGGVGPLVIPGRAAACWNCLELRTRRSFTELDEVIALLASTERRRHPQPIMPGYHPLIAGLVVLETVRHCSGFEETRTIGAQLIWDAATSTIRRLDLVVEESCPHHVGCQDS